MKMTKGKKSQQIHTVTDCRVKCQEQTKKQLLTTTNGPFELFI